jgi:hypothetical protein
MTVGRFQAFRFQVDPTDPPPERDIRWLGLVLGFCALAMGVILLVVYALLSSTVSGVGIPCGAGPNSSTCSLFEYLFLVPGAGLLAAGAIAIVLVFYDLL